MDIEKGRGQVHYTLAEKFSAFSILSPNEWPISFQWLHELHDSGEPQIVLVKDLKGTVLLCSGVLGSLDVEDPIQGDQI